MKQADIDRYYMRIALSQAMRGEWTGSNPRVGCVLVKGSKIIATAYHSERGKDHAEAEALKKAGGNARGSTAYVTLEPCSHYGLTAPCAPKLVDAGVSRAVIGTEDPDPRVSGRGNAILREGGIEVKEGILRKECRWLNRGFIRRQTLGRPWVTLKSAVTLDGKIALGTGESKWITGPVARKMAHLLRGSHDAVMVGAGTCRHDDPRLDNRNSEGTDPLKVIVDPNLAVDRSSLVFQRGKGIIFASDETEKVAFGEEKNPFFKVIRLKPSERGSLAIGDILSKLAGMGVNSLLVEGGARIASDLLRENLVDQLSLFVTPSMVGMGISFTQHIETAHMEDKISLKDVRISHVGKDYLFEGIPECSQAL